MLGLLGKAVTAFAAMTSAVRNSEPQVSASWNFEVPYQGAGVLTVCNNGSSPLTLDSVAWNGNTLGVSNAWGALFPYNAQFSSDNSTDMTTLKASFPNPVSIAPDNCASGTYDYTAIDPRTYFPIVLAPTNVSVTTAGGPAVNLPVIGTIPNSAYPFPGAQLNYYQGDWYGYYPEFSWPSAQDDFNFHDRIIAFALNTAQGDITYPDIDMLSKIIPQEQIKQMQLAGRDVYISEGGWTGSSNFAAIFAADAPNFLAGIQDLASRLAAIGKKLSITLPGGPARMDVLEQGYPGFFKALDAIPNLNKRIMSYDDGDGLWMTNMGSIAPLNDTSVDGAGNSWVGPYNYLISKGAAISSYEFGLPAYTRVLPVTQMSSTHGNGQPIDNSRSPISQFPGQNDGTVDNLCVAKAMGDPNGICYDNSGFSFPSDMTYVPSGSTPDLVSAQTGLVYSNSALYVGSIFDASATVAHMKWALANGINKFFMWQRASDAPLGSPLNIAGTAAAILGNGTAPIPSMTPSPAPASVSPSPMLPSATSSASASSSSVPASASSSPFPATPSASPSPLAPSASASAASSASVLPGPSASLNIGAIAGSLGAGLAAVGAFYACRRRRAATTEPNYGDLSEVYTRL
ncbi:MAG: hypothetical protein K0Q57_338 [Gammaproteobacteria bacterium]|nr:hypothetical protein [Gammaproteobacteria bacterium]